jgi:ribonuclease P protein component
MLPKAQRLSRSDFSSRSLRSAPFAFGSLKFVKGKPAVAVVVSKKVCPLAVSRNKLRRRVYDALRPWVQSGQMNSALIVYPNKKAAAASFQELKTALESALAR